MNASQLRWFVAPLVISIHGVAFGQNNPWVDNTGKYRVDAQFLRLENESVYLRKTDGTEITVPLARLSAASQERARTFQSATADDVIPKNARPGAAIEYKPFFPERWRLAKQSVQMFPWEGQRIVFLSTKANLDAKTMALFLERLDGGWALYKELVGKEPGIFKQHNGKPTVAAVPDVALTCGYGCGYVGTTGIEVAGFYKFMHGGPGDFDLVRKDPQAFPDYYFYEMGRNYYVFGDRHSLFTTGYAVFMRYVCMDALACNDPNLAVRKVIEECEPIYAASDLSFLKGFTNITGGQNEKSHRLTGGDGNLVVPSDQPVIYAAAMLKLRRENGGDDWVRRFFEALSKCPEVKPDTKAGALRQGINWVVSASVAARKDLTPVFVGRWRMPLSKRTQRALSEVEWASSEVNPANIIKNLPIEFEE